MIKDHGYMTKAHCINLMIKTLLYHGHGHCEVSWNFSTIFSIVNKKTGDVMLPMYAYCLAAA
jgi:hypothetical protein